DPGTLPQTRDRPGSDSAAFNARVAALWTAIVTDDPDKGLPFFFPVTAYDQVKDIPQPSNDWNRRLWRNFVRDVHALHARVSRSTKDGEARETRETPRLVSFDVPDDRAKWVDPGHEMNKIGYWRVFGTKLRYESGGETRTIEVTSLISWRGEWYVVHL